MLAVSILSKTRTSGTPFGTPAGAEDDSIEALMDRYVLGEPEAFEGIYRQASPRLFGYLLRLTRHRERAEDLVQVTFTKVHRARSSYMSGAPLLPWLLAIARRSFLDERRRYKVRREDLTHDGALPEPSPETTHGEDDLSELLEAAIRKLPDAYAEAIQLTKITGLSTSEAAEVLGTTSTAVKLRVHRGYNILREELKSHGRNL